MRGAWAELQRVHRERIAAVQAVDPAIVDEPPEGTDGELWRRFHAENMFLEVTNFSEAEITDIFRSAQPFIAETRRRGPKPKSSWADTFLCYMAWAHYGADYAVAAKACQMKTGRFEDNVARARPVLLNTLTARWWTPRQRPRPVAESTWPHVALLVDTNTTETFRPKVRFEEAKVYYDTHNHIYGLKKEVAVMANEPYYCLFTSKGFVGSVHDYDEHKRNVAMYAEYLLKTPEEVHALPQDAANRFWALMADTGYIGPEADTAPIRRVTTTRRNQRVHDARANEEIRRRRVPVEWFFGRLWRSWGILGDVYKWDHANFDADYDICCLLTNELIRASHLAQQDHDFYLRIVTMRFGAWEAKQRKRKEQQAHYKHAKLLRLERLA